MVFGNWKGCRSVRAILKPFVPIIKDELSMAAVIVAVFAPFHSCSPPPDLHACGFSKLSFL